jgi:hypothetical protein
MSVPDADCDSPWVSEHNNMHPWTQSSDERSSINSCDLQGEASNKRAMTMECTISFRFLRCLCFFLIVVAGSSEAQSIYSRHGIGLLSYRDGVKPMGMGGVSLAVADSIALHFVNPANLANVGLTRVQGGFLYERTSIDLQNASGLFHDANINNLMIAIPVKRGYVMALGVQPYSRSNFQFSRSDSIEGGEFYDEIFSGTGGVNELYLAFAATLSTIRVGLSADFYFGQIKRTWRVNFASEGLRNTEDVLNNHFTGVGLHLGVQTELGRWRLGASAGLPSRLNVETTLSTIAGFSSEVGKSKLKLPLWWGVGLGYAPNRHWTLGAQGRAQRWSTVKPEELLGDEAVDGYELGLGVEVIPSFDQLDSYFKRWQFRLGGAYRQLPYEEPVGNKLHEWVMTSGIGLPFGRGFNRLDFAVEFGKRGTLSSNIAEENILLVHASISGGERWFQRGPRR